MMGAVHKLTPEEDIYKICESKADIIKDNKENHENLHLQIQFKKLAEKTHHMQNYSGAIQLKSKKKICI